MPRHSTRSTVLLVPILASVAILPVACGGGGEEQLLNSFFRAARLRDNQTLGNISAVNFNPNTQGIVDRFSISEVGPEQRRTIDLHQLTESHVRAQEEEESFRRKRQEFQSANVDAINRATKIRDSGQPLQGRDAEVYATLEQWQEEHNEYSRRLSAARTQLERDRSRVVSSLTPPGAPNVDISDMELELVTKEVTVDATVRSPDGETAPRTLVFTMQRAIGIRDGETIEGRWIITDLE